MSDDQPTLDSIFQAALEVASPEKRAAFLTQSCGHDLSLRLEVEQLLRSHEQAGSFLDKPAPELAAGREWTALLQAGLAAAFSADAAVVLGNANHSVLRSLGKTMEVPRVVLRESAAERSDPIVQPKSPEMPGRNSDSRYRLDGEIARGGMGAILKGRDTDLGRDLAIKVLLDVHKDNPEVIQRFIEEAQIGGQLQHPGIAPVYELGQFADKRPFFSMKLVKGQTLSKLLADRGEPSADRGKFLGIFEQVCQTMAYAHSRGVIHRDLKPANIMVGAFGEVQVVDWGLAKVLSAGGVADEKKAHNALHGISIIQTLRCKAGSDTPGKVGSDGSHTEMGSVMGTPAYMPPEQALGEIDNMDERADVFGLGAILCEILTGKPPYTGTDSTAVFRQASRGKLSECLARLDACGTDPELIALTKHCLELEPKDRPRDASVLAAGIADYLESVETRLHETETQRAVQTERLLQQQQSARKLQKLVAVLGMVAAIAIGTTLVAGKFWQDASIAKRNAESSEQRAQNNAKSAERSQATAQIEAARAKQKAVEAEQARLDALNQTYLATLNEVRAMRFARQAGWRSAALERLQGLVRLGSGNHDRAELRTEALACLAETDIRLRSKFVSPDIGAWHVRYSPNGQILAYNDDKKNVVYLRDLGTNQELPSIPKAVGLTPFVFHPSGALATSPAAGRVTFYPIQPGQPSFPEIVGDGYALNLAFSGSGERLAVVWGEVDLSNKGHATRCRQIVVYDTATAASLWAVDLPANTQCAYKIALALSPDGRSLATVGPNVEVRVFSVGERSAPIVLGKLDVRICAINFHPNGQSLVAAGRLTGAIWDLKTGLELFRIHAPEGGFWDVGFSPDGQLLGGAVNDRTVRLWDSRSGRELANGPSESGYVCLSLAFAPQGDRFAVGGGSVAVFEIEGRRECRYETSATNTVSGLAFDKTQPTLLACGGGPRVHAWNLNEPTATVLRTISRRENPSIMQLAPDGRQLVFGFSPFTGKRNYEFSISVCRLDDPDSERHLKGPQDRVSDLSFDPPGKHLAAASGDGGLYLWEFETGALLYRLDLAGVLAVRFLDETQFIAAAGKRLVLLAAHDGALRRELTLPTEASTFVITPDRREALVGTLDGTIHRVSLPDLAIQQSRKLLDQHSHLLMAISADGDLLAVTAITGPHNLLINPRTLEPLARFPENDKSMKRLEFDHGGRYLAMSGDRITLWDLALVRGELMRLGLDFSDFNTLEQTTAHYSKLIFAQPTDAHLLARRAAAYISTQQWELARADWRRIVAKQPNQIQSALYQFQKAERWNEAAEFGLLLIEQKPQDSQLWIRVAPIMVLSEDEVAYGKFCKQVAEAAGNTPAPEVADRAIKACLLRAGAIDLAELPGDALARSLDEGTASSVLRPWGWATRALLAYRSGDAESAVKYVTRSEENHPIALTHALNLAVLAMAQHKLQHPDEARLALKSGAQVIARLKEDVNSKFHPDVRIAEILLREAENLINGPTKTVR